MIFIRSHFPASQPSPSRPGHGLIEPFVPPPPGLMESFRWRALPPLLLLLRQGYLPPGPERGLGPILGRTGLDGLGPVSGRVVVQDEADPIVCTAMSISSNALWWDDMLERYIAALEQNCERSFLAVVGLGEYGRRHCSRHGRPERARAGFWSMLLS